MRMWVCEDGVLAPEPNVHDGEGVCVYLKEGEGGGREDSTVLKSGWRGRGVDIVNWRLGRNWEGILRRGMGMVL